MRIGEKLEKHARAEAEILDLQRLVDAVRGGATSEGRE